MRTQKMALSRIVLAKLAFLTLLACQGRQADRGTIHSDNSGQIINGLPVSEQDAYWKHTVSVGPAEEPQCTGVLVYHQFVLTAAHCVEAIEGTYVHFGRDFKSPQAVRLKIKKIIGHEDYCSVCTGGLLLGATNDIALVQFEGTAPAGFEFAELAQKSELQLGQKVVLAGFGANEKGDFETVMKFTEVPLKEVGDSEFATDETASGSCSGDSGGPAFVEVGGRLKLAGLTSRGDARCRMVGIYTIPQAFEDWILDILTTPEN